MAVASNKYQAATAKLIDRYFPAGTFCVVLGQREGIEPKARPDHRVRHSFAKRAAKKRKPFMWAIPKSIC